MGKTSWWVVGAVILMWVSFDVIGANDSLGGGTPPRVGGGAEGEDGDAEVSRDRASKRRQLSPVRSATRLYRLHQRANLRNGKLGNPEVLADQPGGGGLAGGDVAANGPAGVPGWDTDAYSHTNVQVEGVDEGDTVKTDGSYLYAIHESTVCLIETPADGSLRLTSTIQFESEFYPGELYLYGSVLVVVGSLESFPWLIEEPGVLVATTDDVAGRKLASGADLVPFNEPKVAVKVYDVSNRAEPRLVRDFSLSGVLLGTRRSGDFLYVVGEYWPMLANAGARANESGGRRLSKRKILERLIPRVRDQAATDLPDELEQPLPVEDISYFQGLQEFSYLNVAGLNLADHASPAKVKSFVGSGSMLYVSAQHLFVAHQNWGWGTDSGDTTDISKFVLQDGVAEYSGGATVPGSLLNQFSMDEYGKNLRLATTVWAAGTADLEATQTNSVYVLDEQMEQIGKLEGLAEGESIFAARFIQDRCYLVTFRQVDPFFVIDLSQPAAPAVLGELKIPGFSTYLHPYDSTHILGFGMEVDEAFPGVARGLKVGLFDVTDPAHPVQSHQILLGEDRFSPILYDYKSLLFSRSRNLLAFPVDRINSTGTADEWQDVSWDNEVQVYNLTLEQGFSLRGSFSHNSATTSSWLRYRLLYSGNNLYSVSDVKVMTHDLETLNEKAALPLP